MDDFAQTLYIQVSKHFQSSEKFWCSTFGGWGLYFVNSENPDIVTNVDFYLKCFSNKKFEKHFQIKCDLEYIFKRFGLYL